MSLRDLGTTAEPEAVRSFAGILADWLGSYTMPAPLGAEMAEALEAGSGWAGAIASTAVRRAGWPDAESVAWGICVAALAGALESARRSLDGAAGRRDPGATADGPARSLLAADGMIAAAHETLSALGRERLIAAIDALEEEFGEGGPWRSLAERPVVDGSASRPDPPAWSRLVALALAPASTARPDGPWAELAAGWKGRYGGLPAPDDGGGPPFRSRPDGALFEHPAVDASTSALLRAAAAAARGHDGNGSLAGA